MSKTPFSVGRSSFVIENVMQMSKEDFVKENKSILGNPGKAYVDMKKIHDKAIKEAEKKAKSE